MNQELQALLTKVTAAETILVAIPGSASPDIMAAALALYLSLSQSGKNVSVVAATAPVVRDSHLVGVDKIATDVGGKNLVLTINAPEDVVDKVTSNTEGGHLNLIIMPKKGGNPLTEKDVTFSYTGAAADLVIAIGAGALADFGALAEKEHELFAEERLANISNIAGTFGSVNLTDPSSSNCELATAVIQELHLPLDVDIAGNLMRGIEAATENLQSDQMTADTFEALAVLYRSGARRSRPQAITPSVTVVSDVPIVDNVSSVPAEPKPATSPKEDWSRPKIYSSSKK